MKYLTDDLRILSMTEVVSPAQIHREFPLTEEIARTVYDTRQAIHNILHGRDDRLLVIIGPCSIHDIDAGLEYAHRLKNCCDELRDRLLIVMRVYFEKPRTTVGWKGLINDPDLDGSFKIDKGLRLARRFLLDVNRIGVPAAVEFLDLISPQYIADTVSWGAIGARTTESQCHRELASGLSCPVGFKNGTDGNRKIAIDAIRAASQPHSFLSVTKAGHSAIFSTQGNEDCHIILRGGKQPNYDTESVQACAADMEKAGIQPSIMVDCSHANSRKDPANQVLVIDDIHHQLSQGEPHIIGVMIESHLQAGRQDIVPGQPMTYGQSITDACIGWEESEGLLQKLAEAVELRRQAKTALAV